MHLPVGVSLFVLMLLSDFLWGCWFGTSFGAFAGGLGSVTIIGRDKLLALGVFGSRTLVFRRHRLPMFSLCSFWWGWLIVGCVTAAMGWKE